MIYSEILGNFLCNWQLHCIVYRITLILLQKQLFVLLLHYDIIFFEYVLCDKDPDLKLNHVWRQQWHNYTDVITIKKVMTAVHSLALAYTITKT